MFKVFIKREGKIIAYESIGDYAITQNGVLLKKNTRKNDDYDKVLSQDDFVIINMKEITDKCLKAHITVGGNEIKIYKHNDIYLGCELTTQSNKWEWCIIFNLKQFLYNMCH